VQGPCRDPAQGVLKKSKKIVFFCRFLLKKQTFSPSKLHFFGAKFAKFAEPTPVKPPKRNLPQWHNSDPTGSEIRWAGPCYLLPSGRYIPVYTRTLRPGPYIRALFTARYVTGIPLQVYTNTRPLFQLPGRFSYLDWTCILPSDVQGWWTIADQCRSAQRLV